ncbi:MAG TPA: DUF4259 domain-containing protein [Phycisphaerales bacterium]|nr:DUF4259 domain-containing protein [Phycisphaerales bacterium]
MGAWGHHAFENDVACDWAAAFVELPDKRRWLSRKQDKMTRLRATLASAASNGELSSAAALERGAELEEVLGASEVVAALAGAPGYQLAAPDAYTEDLVRWIRTAKVLLPPGLLESARDAVRLVLDGSSLAELWGDDEDGAEWRKVTENLLQRLESKAGR